MDQRNQGEGESRGRDGGRKGCIPWPVVVGFPFCSHPGFCLSRLQTSGGICFTLSAASPPFLSLLVPSFGPLFSLPGPGFSFARIPSCPGMICPQSPPLLPTLLRLAARVVFPKHKPDAVSPLPGAPLGSLVPSEESPGFWPQSRRPCTIGLLPGRPPSFLFGLCPAYSSPSFFLLFECPSCCPFQTVAHCFLSLEPSTAALYLVHPPILQISAPSSTKPSLIPLPPTKPATPSSPTLPWVSLFQPSWVVPDDGSVSPGPGP